METIDISHTEEIYTVSRLNREVRFLLEGTYPLLWVEGEISNFVAPHSGHWYFSLKDSQAQVRCAMFKPQNRFLGMTPKDGMRVVIKARISLYENRGDYQLLAEFLEEAGTGKLQQEFEALKKKLSAAGLFDPIHKKPVPALPKTIGVITSATGAAIRDIISVLKRRYAACPVIVYPTLVQGEKAAASIVKAIETANQRNEVDAIILARGGGSIEDLWAFNEEIVAHAIFKSKIFIISGVGHEIDFTIADFVADVRAPTPSAAAELITPDIEQLTAFINQSFKGLTRLITQKIIASTQQLAFIQKQLQQLHPKRKLAEQSQQLDFYEIALVQLQLKKITGLKAQLETLNAKFLANTPKLLIRETQHQINAHTRHLENVLLTQLRTKQQLLAQLAGRLDALSPLATLKRGFAIATTSKNQKILSSSTQVSVGEKIHLKLLKGSIDCLVDGVYED